MRLLYINMLLLFTLVCKGQLYDKTWVVSQEAAKIVFTDSLVSVDSFLNPVYTDLSWSSICDKEGELKFFSSGWFVYNKDGNLMQGGSGMVDQGVLNIWQFGGPFPQGGSLIFPITPNLYYLVYFSISDDQINTTGPYAPDQLFYAQIDMSLDNGLGAVISKKNILYPLSMVDNHMTACRHANGRDWWLIVNRYQTNQYLKWLVSANGFEGPYSESIGTAYMESDNLGQLSFSSDGSKIAGVSGNSKINIIDFDRCTGELNNAVYITVRPDTIDYSPNPIEILKGGGVSLAFSPNGRFLYLSLIKALYQYDLWNANIEASRKTIWKWDTTQNSAFIRTMYLAPNGQILVSCNNGLWCSGINVIASPDLLDTNCNFKIQEIAIPNLNPDLINNTFNYRLGALAGSACDTVINDINEPGSLTSYIKVAPNPAKDKLEISLYKYLPNAQMIIADELGRVVYENHHYYLDEYLDVSRWNAGIYYVKIYNTEKALTAKFLKE